MRFALFEEAALDRIADRVPELDLSERRIDWTKLPDGAEALLVDDGGIDGGAGAKTAALSPLAAPS